MIPAIPALALLSGILGRMGGAKGFNNLYRRIGCSLLWLVAIWLVLGFSLANLWIYGLIFVLSWYTFSTYWDWLFGFDNMWFSGFMVGMASYPLVFIDNNLFSFVLIRAVLLCIIWGMLNKFLPQKVLLWTRDIVEEFCRYLVSI